MLAQNMPGGARPSETRSGETRPNEPVLGDMGSNEAGLDQAILSKTRRARARIAEVRRTLTFSPDQALAPQDIGACAPLMEEAIACLQAIPSGEAEANLVGELAGLRFELGVLERILEGGTEFYRGWGRVLAAATAGYTPSGDPAALTEPGSLSLQG